MTNLFKITLILFAVLTFTACNNAPAEEASAEATPKVEVKPKRLPLLLKKLKLKKFKTSEVNANEAKITESAD